MGWAGQLGQTLALQMDLEGAQPLPEPGANRAALCGLKGGQGGQGPGRWLCGCPSHASGARGD